MPRATPIQASFAGGELDPLLSARTDLARWQIGLATCSNFLVLPQGGVARRPGFRHIGWGANPLGRTRLVPFVASTEQAFVIELGDQRARFLVNGGLLQDGGAIRVITTPWRAEDLAGLVWAQSADVLYVVHPAYPPHTISWTGSGVFNVAPLALVGHPFRPERADTLALTASGVTGSITITASAPFFEGGHVGAVLRLSEPSGVLAYQAWRTEMAITRGATVQHDGRVYEALNDGNSGQTPPIHETGDVYSAGSFAGGVAWRYLHDGRGHARVLAVQSPTQVTATVINRLPGTASTTRWQEGAWSAARGYPMAVTLYEQRLWLAATRSDPITLWASQSGDYLNFTDGAEDDAAIAATMAVTQANVIRWLAAGPGLAVGTSGGIFAVTSFTGDSPVTPGSLRIVRATAEGASSLLPLVVEGALICVGRSGRRLIEFAGGTGLDGWQATDISIAAEHITREGITALAWAGEPGRTAWGIVAGQLVALTYRRDQQILAWHRHPTDGVVEDLAVVPSPDGRQDQLWITVQRTAGGQRRRRLELLAPPFQPADANDRQGLAYLDAAAGWDGAVATSLAVSSGSGGLVSLTAGAAVFAADQVGRRVCAGTRLAEITSVTSPTVALARVLAGFEPGQSFAALGWAIDAGTLSGLDHLAGREVVLVLEGAPAGTARVSEGGTVALPRRVVRAEVGLGFASVLETLPLEAGTLGGSAQGRQKRLARLTVRLHQSAGGTIASGRGAPVPLVRPPPDLRLGVPPPWFSGDVEVMGTGGWERAGRVRITQDAPLPLSVLSLMPTVLTTEG